MSLQIPKDARIEVKFVTRLHAVDRIRNWLALHPACFYQPFPDRKINNVYFDTFDCDSYSENLAGSSSRAKLRYRWYGDSEYPDSGVLELKLKRNFFGWKQRMQVAEMPFSDNDSWSLFRKNLESSANFHWRWALHTRPAQTILNRYSREYYVSGDEKVRFTIDYDQVVFDQRYRRCPNVVNKTSIPRAAIIECKFDRKDRSLASSIIQSLPIRVGRSSKYVLALKSMHGF